jgi:hypothetical protein
MKNRNIAIPFALLSVGVAILARPGLPALHAGAQTESLDTAVESSAAKFEEGRQIFRFDTFGDQAFWGGALKLHKAIEGSKLGGVGTGVSPNTALAVGLKGSQSPAKLGPRSF